MGPEDCERFQLEEEEEAIRILGDPRLPSDKEVKEHYLSGHIQYRNWCKICVKAQGRESDHRQEVDKERSGKEGAGSSPPINASNL